MKKLFKITALVIMIVAVFGVLASCSQTAEPAASSAAASQAVSSQPAAGSADAAGAPSASAAAAATDKASGDITIGFLAMNRSMTWMQYALKSAQAEADKLGVKMVVEDANNDVAKQTSMMEDLITQKVKAIITDPINVDSLSPAIKEAVDAGIPVVTFDRRAEGAPYTAFVGSDDKLAGQLAADFINEKLKGNGNVVEIVGADGSSPSIDRGTGFHAQMQKYPGLKIVISQSGQFIRENGMNVMEDAITSLGNKGFDAVYAYNDDMMMGAIQAMKDAQVDLSKIVTISNDGIPDALNAINAGDLNATIQYPSIQAGQAVQEAVNYIQTGKAPDPKDALVKPWVITKDNLSSGDFYDQISK